RPRTWASSWATNKMIPTRLPTRLACPSKTRTVTVAMTGMTTTQTRT
ncbi:uncharacterized protein METZ01_LOCUS450442, partial [marine metagenome]